MVLLIFTNSTLCYHSCTHTTTTNNNNNNDPSNAYRFNDMSSPSAHNDQNPHHQRAASGAYGAMSRLSSAFRGGGPGMDLIEFYPIEL